MDADGGLRRTTRRATNARTNGRKGKGKKKRGTSTVPDFNKLEMASLRKYVVRYKVPVPTHAVTKAELVQAVKKHFVSQLRVIESDVLAEFISVNNKAKRERLQFFTNTS